MHIRGRRPWLVLLLLLVIGLAIYRLGIHVPGMYHYRAALAALEQRDLVEAGNHLERCLEHDPGDLSVRLLAAQTARRRRDYAAAMEHLARMRRATASPKRPRWSIVCCTSRRATWNR